MRSNLSESTLESTLNCANAIAYICVIQGTFLFFSFLSVLRLLWLCFHGSSLFRLRKSLTVNVLNWEPTGAVVAETAALHVIKRLAARSDWKWRLHYPRARHSNTLNTRYTLGPVILLLVSAELLATPIQSKDSFLHNNVPPPPFLVFFFKLFIYYFVFGTCKKKRKRKRVDDEMNYERKKGFDGLCTVYDDGALTSFYIFSLKNK